jgi:hypothetical protein
VENRSQRSRRQNKVKSKTRVRVERMFGHMINTMREITVRSIGIDRVWLNISVKNLAYNIQRYLDLLDQEKASQSARVGITQI